MGLPTWRKVESAPERSTAQFGVLRPATDDLLAALRRHVREIPEDKIVRHEGGRYWTDTESGEELELIRAFVDPVSPDDANCVAFTVRDSLVVPFKRRHDEGQVKSTPVGGMGGRLVAGRERP
jgi:hypothetical protein